MEKSILFKGISYNRSEQLAEIGECSFLEGAEIVDGALRPAVVDGTPVGKFQGTLLYVHEANGYTHYICRSGSGLIFYVDGGSSSFNLPSGIIDVANLTVGSFGSMGNTLIITAPAQGLFYIRWDANTSAYIYLGQKPPMLSIQFRPGKRPDEPDYDQTNLKVRPVDKNSPPINRKSLPWTFQVVMEDDTCPEVFTSNANRVDDEHDYSKEYDAGEVGLNTSESNAPTIWLFKNIDGQTKYLDLYIRSPFRSQVTESAHALINRTHDNIASKGRFYAPFFARYIYRMYDGSIYCGSAPILVSAEIKDVRKMFLCNTTPGNNQPCTSQRPQWPLEVTKNYVLNYDQNTIVFAYKPIDFNLEYKIDPESIDELKRWQDVITSVDFFISPPLIWNDDSKLIEKIYPDLDKSCDYDINQNGEPERWRPVESSFDPVWNYSIDIPQVYPTSYEERFEQTSVFYRLKSIKLEEIKAMYEFEDVGVKPEIIKNITTQERMKTDEFGSYNTFIPSGQYIYNNRLNIFGVYESLFQGFPAQSLLQAYNDGSYTIYEVAVKLATNDGIIWVRKSCYAHTSLYMLGVFPMYYPDPRAIMMQLYNGLSYITFKMKEHPELNGSITDVTSLTHTTESQCVSTKNIASLDDDILTSQAGNPFTFAAKDVTNVSNGRVVALTSATRALSQGQFGSFPLIALCTDGIWALSVAPDGGYSAVNPISREVCAYKSTSYDNGVVTALAKAVVQLDQSVMFTTERALCQLSGSEVVQLSQSLVGPVPDIKSLFGQSSDLTALKHAVPALTLIEHPLTDIPIVNGDMSVRPLYDYIGRRLLVFQNATNGMVSADGKSSPCLIYTSSDKQFSSMHAPALRSLINSYPYPYVQLDSGSQAGTVLRLDKDRDLSETDHYILLVTRHMSFGGYRDVINALRHEKGFSAIPAVFIFGSQDTVKDYLIGTVSREHADYLPGHPFRYYRIAMALTMKQYERYTSLILGITERHSKL